MTRSVSEGIRDALDRHRRWVLLVFTLALFVMLAARARAKPFWHDEVYTILASRLPIATLWRASRDGLDLAPPLNTILTRLTHAVLGVGPVSTRLPPMLGFGSACLLVFVMVRRRSNTLIGLAAALVPCFTGAFPYAYEARGYDLTVGLFALALFGWSEAASGRHRHLNLWLMGIALSAGVWAHYYAVIAFLPIAIGELARQMGRRRLDLAPWVALAGAGVGTLPLVPLLVSSLPQASTFWTRLEPTSVARTYDDVLGSIYSSQFSVAGFIVVALALVELTRRLRRGLSSSRHLEAYEVAAGLCSLAIPAVAMLIAGMTGGAFMPRYTLLAVVGFALVVPLAIWRFAPDAAAADVILCLTLVVPFAREAARTPKGDAFELPNPIDDRPLLTQQLAGDEPMVLSGGLAYLQLWYYLPPDQQRRGIYLADPKTELRETRTDTLDRGYLALARWTPVPIREYDAFVREHRAFRVYGCGPHWLSRRLRDDGAVMGEVRYELGCLLYSVRLPGG